MFACLCTQAQSLTGTWLAAYRRDLPSDKRVFYYKIYLQQHQDSVYGICQALDAMTDIRGLNPETADVQSTYHLFNHHLSAADTTQFVLTSGEQISNGAVVTQNSPPMFLTWVCTVLPSGKNHFEFTPRIVHSLQLLSDGQIGNIVLKKLSTDIPPHVNLLPLTASKLSLKLPSLFRKKKPVNNKPQLTLETTTPIEERKDVVHRIIETEAAEATIDLYDNGMVDDDTVSLYFNGRLLIDRQKVSEVPLRLTVRLDKEVENRFILFAHNEGKIPPNTALLVIRTGQARHELTLKSTLTENAVVLLLAKPLQTEDAKEN